MDTCELMVNLVIILAITIVLILLLFGLPALPKFRLPKIQLFNRTKPNQLKVGDIIYLRLPSGPMDLQVLGANQVDKLYQFRVVSKYNSGVIVEGFKTTINGNQMTVYNTTNDIPQPLEYELLNRCPVFSIIN